MRTILLYWFNSSTKKNAIHLDVGISLEGKSLTGTEIDKTEMVSLKDYFVVISVKRASVKMSR